MSSVCPLWNQVLYQTCLCERHTVTRPLSRRQTYTRVQRHNLTWQQKLCNNAPSHRLHKKPDRTQRGMHQCPSTNVHCWSFQLTFMSHSLSYFCKTEKWERGPCSEPAALEVPILEEPWYQQPQVRYTPETQAYSVAVKYSDRRSVETGRTP